MTYWWLAVCVCVAAAGAEAAPLRRVSSRGKPAPAKAAAVRPAPGPVLLRVEPARIHLSGPEGRQQILVTGQFADGSEQDLTHSARYTARSAHFQVSPSGVLTSHADGASRLSILAGGRSLAVPVTVSGSRGPASARLATDVVPVLTRVGCNMGACHGAAAGQNGFRLSLRGFDPDLDHQQIVREKEGARINVQRPEASLLLQKATGEIPHGGGARFLKGSPEYQVLLRWIRAGAPGVDPGFAIAAVEVRPEQRVLPRPGLTQQLQVTARYSDGSRADVTHRARFNSNDEAVASVDDGTGRVRAERGGAAAIMVSYGGFVVVARTLVPVQARAPVDYARLPRGNFIDALVYGKLAQLRIQPSRDADDPEFLRRVYLDVIGTLPTPEEAERFLADRMPDRRARLIDALLERPEFVDYRALKLADLLRVNSQYLSQEGADTFYRWIRSRVRQNAGFDQLVRELLTGRGSNFHVGPANLFRIANDPEKLAETVGQTFLGVRLNCAKCHNHPFENWQQKDYYSLAAFFAGVGRKGGPEFGESQITVRGEGQIDSKSQVRHPRTNEVLAPKYLGGVQPQIAPGADRREYLAAWITSKENDLFARVAVNRLWAELFGRGIVDPVDDFRASNPPANEELLSALARQFVALDYNVKAMLRLMLNSRVYQLSSEMTPSNAEDTRHFARSYPKRLPAEVLADALDAATGKQTRYGNLPAGTRAIQIHDSRIGSYLLEVFGRPKREIVCSCERDPQPNLSQMLNLVNGSDLNGRISAPDGRIARALQERLSDEQIVTRLYLATLSRHPRPDELRLSADAMRKAGDRKAALEDILWALINSQEFIFNH